MKRERFDTRTPSCSRWPRCCRSSVFLSYRFASRLIAYLGETGTAVFLRLLSSILLCVGVAIIWSGLVDLVQPLLAR